MSGFFEEIKRRKVYRVAVAYVVVAGGIIQLASATFPAWELPNWSLRLVIVLLLIGFPIVLILAWAFDVTPEGIQRTPRAEGSTRPRHTRRNMALLCVVGLIISAAAGFFLLPRASAKKLDKSIAVLPFESFSQDKDNAFFADGIQDDILTNLAKIGDLKVISRTSVMPYRGKGSSVREIGKALGVSAVLEGTVRKDGNRIRVNVQLINAGNDEHIWAEDYDRDLTDVFAIQTDLAQKIASELRAKLSPSEKAQIARKPTENGEAYLAFVQARNLFMPEDLEKLKQAAQLYERALQLDPDFALALASHSQVESWIFHTYDPVPARREKARALAERALQKQPDLPEAHLARGFAYYYGEQNFEAALREFEVAQKGLPNESGVYLAIGAIQRRQGRWAESTANLEKAATLNPNATWPLQNLFFNYEMTRAFEAANRTIDRALALDPKAFSLWELKARHALAEKGDLSVALNGLERLKQLPAEAVNAGKLADAQIRLLLLQRRYEEALQMAEALRDESLADFPGAVTGKYQTIGFLRQRLGDEAGARKALLQARELAEAQVQAAPDDPNRHAQLAQILGLSGEKEAARAEAKRAMDLLPESRDAFGGPDITL
ncbi:MAG: hypothetical protein H0T95_07810, partial [Chthoniobacterales bacterium]|nr:hypothetical protein [Chthoniobacterales bacterium]